jgi:hypothetical protein
MLPSLRHQETYIAPSWSWIALERDITPAFEAGRKSRELQKKLDPDLAATVEHVEVQTSSSDPFGQVSSGLLRLNGYLIETTFREGQDSYFSRSNGTVLRDQNGTSLGVLTLDTRPSGPVECKILCLSISEWERSQYGDDNLKKCVPDYDHGETKLVEGLVLAASAKSPDMFMRIGIFRSKLPENATRRSVNII